MKIVVDSSRCSGSTVPSQSYAHLRAASTTRHRAHELEARGAERRGRFTVAHAMRPDIRHDRERPQTLVHEPLGEALDPPAERDLDGRRVTPAGRAQRSTHVVLVRHRVEEHLADGDRREVVHPGLDRARVLVPEGEHLLERPVATLGDLRSGPLVGCDSVEVAGHDVVAHPGEVRDHVAHPPLRRRHREGNEVGLGSRLHQLGDPQAQVPVGAPVVGHSADATPIGHDSPVPPMPQ